MSEPGLLQSGPQVQGGERSLWSHASGWRTLVVLASVLTLTAVATPLLLPQPVDKGFAPQVAPSHLATKLAPPKTAIAQLLPAGTASLAHQTKHPKARPSALVEQDAVRPKLHTASLGPQPEPAAGSGGAAQPATGESALDLANLPVGTEIVSSGVLARVNRHNRYVPQLGGDLPVSITIISPPAHGTVSTQMGTAPITFANAGISRVSSVTNVFYQSAPGFVGQDSFTYKRTSPDPNDPLNARTYTVNVYVK